MAKMLPNYIAHEVSDGEREVFNKFQQDNDITKDWFVLHSYNISEHIRHRYNGEADFVVLIPDKGILVLEVKAHRKIIYDESGWTLGTSGDHRDPLKQARENMFSIKNSYINSIDKNILTSWAVVFTHVDTIEDRNNNTYSATEFRDFPTIGSDIFWSDNFFKQIEFVMDKDWKVHYPYAKNLGNKINILVDLLRPCICGVESPKAYYERTKKEIIHLDGTQVQILDIVFNENNKRILITGGAGTGKTVMAVEAFNREFLKGNNVLYITFNRSLNNWVCSKFDLSSAYSTITTIEQLAVIWTTTPEEFMPVFDVLIIDEAQDIIFSPETERYFNILNEMLSNNLYNGRWIMFGDFSSLQSQHFEVKGKTIQEVYNNFINTFNGVTVLDLKKNYRNPNKIINICNHVFHQPLDSVRNDEQNSIQIVEFENSMDEVIKIEEIIVQVLNEGFSKKDIVLLSASSFNSANKRATELMENYHIFIEPFHFDSQEIRYSSVGKFKGLESPIIILSNVSKSTSNSSLYTGITRATCKVYILTNKYFPTVRTLEMLELLN
jgi:hypothetical protein